MTGVPAPDSKSCLAGFRTRAVAGGKHRRISWAALGEAGRLVGFRWEDWEKTLLVLRSGHGWPRRMRPL